MENNFLKSFTWANQEIISCKICDLDYCKEIIHRDFGAQTTETPKENLAMLMDTFETCRSIATQRCHARLNAYKKLKGSSIHDVLEIGCGPGIFYEPFTNEKIEWTGLEINPMWLKWGANNNIPIENGLICDYKERFDLIFACQLLEHFEKPRQFLKDILGALRPGGLLHFEVPNHNSFVSNLRKISPLISHKYGCIQPTQHMRAYSAQTLNHLFSDFHMNLKLLSAFPNDHKVWGQVRVKQPLINRMAFRISDFLGRGSLLVGIAQKK
ncbi:MAG: class I SAM-dependent methyltransferase [Fidelibacterota bacterium]